MIGLLALILGAALGAPARYVIETRMHAASPQARFPWALLVINTIGCLIAGIAAATTDGALRMFLLVGFCGALTTFSGYGWAMHGLQRDRGPYLTALLVLPASCFAALALPFLLLR